MGINEFNSLSVLKKDDVIAKEGVHIGGRGHDHYMVILYQLHSFYVEIYYDVDNNTLDHFKSFLSTDLLDVYLDKINISELVA